MATSHRLLDSFQVPSGLSFEVGWVRERLPPGWRVVVLDVDGGLVVSGEAPVEPTAEVAACLHAVGDYVPSSFSFEVGEVGAGQVTTAKSPAT
jgi:hypothetical protein